MNDISTPDVPALILAYAGPQERLLERERRDGKWMAGVIESVREIMKRESEQLPEQPTSSLQRWWKRVVQKPSKIRDSMRDYRPIRLASAVLTGLMFILALFLMVVFYAKALSAAPSSTTREHARLE